MYSALSTLNTMTEVLLIKVPDPQLLLRRRSINCCPLLRVCVHGVCVFTAVCVHFGWVKRKERILSMGTWSYVTSHLKKLCRSFYCSIYHCSLYPNYIHCFIHCSTVLSVCPSIVISIIQSNYVSCNPLFYCSIYCYVYHSICCSI